MKPIISKTDFNKLRELNVNQSDSCGKNLGQTITKALIIEENEMDKHTVCLNSRVELRDISSNKNIKIQIVMPDFADLKERRISVFAPISAALLGFKELDKICWATSTGASNFEIVKVINE